MKDQPSLDLKCHQEKNKKREDYRKKIWITSKGLASAEERLQMDRQNLEVVEASAASENQRRKSPEAPVSVDSELTQVFQDVLVKEEAMVISIETQPRSDLPKSHQSKLVIKLINHIILLVLIS